MSSVLINVLKEEGEREKGLQFMFLANLYISQTYRKCFKAIINYSMGNTVNMSGDCEVCSYECTERGKRKKGKD